MDVITGTVLQAEAGRRLTVTFDGLWDPATAELPESTVTFTVFEPPAVHARAIHTAGFPLIGQREQRSCST